jgi:protoheme IX farnesyltransferase
MRSNVPSAGLAASLPLRGEHLLALTKPGLTAMSVCTAAGGAYLAGGNDPSYVRIIFVVAGTFLVGGGAVALNQFLERTYDARMKRTEHRPLPAGHVSPPVALLLGIGMVLAGVIVLAATTNGLAALLAMLTAVTYAAVYTPLKRFSQFATAVGGVPGALPPVIGWVAVRGGITIEAYILFLLLYLWQMPHFLSLAWMYRDDYARGGYRLLPVFDHSGVTTGRLVVVYTAALIPASILLSAGGMMGSFFLYGGILAGVGLLVPSFRFLRDRSITSARRVFFASLLYLSVILILMVLDRVASQFVS